MKRKSFGDAAHVRAVFAPDVLLTRAIFRLNNTPEPERGVKSFEKAEIRRVLIGPLPGTMLPDTFQFVTVRPVPDTGGFWKVITVSSKVMSPWKPTRLSATLMLVVTTGWVKLVTAVVTVAVGNATAETTQGGGVGVGGGTVAVAVAVAVAVGVKVAVVDGVNVAVAVGVNVAVAVAVGVNVAVAVAVGVGLGQASVEIVSAQPPAIVPELPGVSSTT